MTEPDPRFLRARLHALEENEPAEGTEPKSGQAIRWLIAVTEHMDVTERLERLEGTAGTTVCRDDDGGHDDRAGTESSE